MRIAFADFETYWNRKTKHSLTSMHPIEYVMSPDTELQVLTIAVDNGPVDVIVGEDSIQNYCAQVDWSNMLLVAHNGNGFDHMIFAWRLGIRPAMWGDTLAMAAPIYGTTVGGSLKKLADVLKVGEKGSLEATNTEGLYVKDWAPEMLDSIRRYAGQDTALCRALFRKLLPHTSSQELKLIDLTARMLVEPGFDCDLDLLRHALAEEQERKLNALKSIANIVGVSDLDTMQKALMSNPKFAELLAQFDVEVPKKISPTTGRETLALSKTDSAFLALQEHDNPIVAAAAQARLGAKSTILESRIKTFITMAEQHPHNRMPIALKYWGASTGRWSGALKANQQNLPRRNPKDPKPSDVLRMCLTAPRGYKVVVADLSGIELRVNHTLWQVQESMDLYADDPEADLYKAFAAKLYNKKREDVTKNERQFAKLCQLGLGYGMSAGKFRITAGLQGVQLTQEEAEHAVAAWRATYWNIVEGWDKCGDAIKSMSRGSNMDIDPWGHCRTEKNLILTPHSQLRYPDLRREEDEDTGKSNWVYGQGRNKRRIYSSHLDENLVQHIARTLIAQQALAIAKEYPVHHMVHDEIVCIVPEHRAKDALAFVLDVMRTPPAWWPEIVLWAEGDIADSYGEAK
jgi:DNA polymerase bacteriophage-type